MRYIVAAVVVWLLALLDVSAMPYLKVLGVTPDFVLIFAASWAVVRGQNESLVIVPLAGFLRDLPTSDPLGTSVLAFIPVVLLASAVRLRALDSQFLPTVAVVLGGSVAYGVMAALVLSATGQSIDWLHAILRVIAPLALVNALFAPIVYLPLHWLAPAPSPGILGPRRVTSPL